MKVLVVTWLCKGYKGGRKTFEDSAYSFARYCQSGKVEIYYYNIANASNEELFSSFGMKKLKSMGFDAVIYHYTYMVHRENKQLWDKVYEKVKNSLAEIGRYRVIMVHDEYVYTGAIRQAVDELGIDRIYTSARPEQYETLYPGRGDKCRTMYTGYVDEQTLERINERHDPNAERPIDVGYRVNSLPFWFGRHSQLKALLADRMKEQLKKTSLNVSIEDSADPKNRFLGEAWFDFLLSCRTMLGCLGGSSMLNVDDAIVNSIEKYIKNNPNAGFDETERDVFPGKDNTIKMFLLAPRHFECAMTRTCQVLVEEEGADYWGVFEPNKHYIPLKEDFSNADEVIRKISDVELCRSIAERCYEDIVARPDGKYTYRVFAQSIIDDIEKNLPQHISTNEAKETDKLLKRMLAQKRAVDFLMSICYMIKCAYNAINGRLHWLVAAIPEAHGDFCRFNASELERLSDDARILFLINK